MLPNELPEIINPFKLCRQNQGNGMYLSGNICVSKLSGDLCNKQLLGHQPIQLELKFFYSLDEVHVIQGRIISTLRLNCQRCLEDFEQVVSQEIYVGVVETLEDAKKLPSQYEPLLTKSGKVRLEEWVAEEIQLAIPIVPMHADACGVSTSADTGVVTKQGSKVFPFADLNQKLSKLSREVES